MEYSTKIYEIYLKYITPEDIHVYSIDEEFMDVTAYLKTYSLSARELTAKIIQDIISQTSITATVGIRKNLYLCKIAMDIVAKHVEPDKNGVRIAQKLTEHEMFTMCNIARCSIGNDGNYYNEDLLYNLFGVNAELLIDHAWGWEPTTIDLIKQYKSIILL